jgi:hypothetical protein
VAHFSASRWAQNLDIPIPMPLATAQVTAPAQVAFGSPG